MKTLARIVLVAVLMGAAPAYAQEKNGAPVTLTDAERARVGADWTGYFDQNCQPRTRAIEHHREVVRFQCPEGVRIVDVATGTVTPEPHPSLGARLKRWGWLAVVGTVGVIYLLGHPE